MRKPSLPLCGGLPLIGVVPYVSVAHSAQPIEQPCDHHKQLWPSPLPSTPLRRPISQPFFGPSFPPFPLLLHGCAEEREEREDNRCRTAGEGYEQCAYHVHASIGLFPPSNSGSARSIAFRGVGMYIAPCATATSRNASSIMASVPFRFGMRQKVEAELG